MDNATRPTIGFLTANIHIGAARVLWPGVLDAAQAGQANLICYPGGRLNSSEEFESQRNLIYQLTDAERLDGLVSWSSALTGTVTSAEVADFHRRYQPLPIVSLASTLGQAGYLGGQLTQPQPLSIICPFKASNSQLIITNNCSRTTNRCPNLFFRL